MADNFNLLDEPWMPILRTTGKTERIGLRAALLEAGSIRQIAASNPMDNAATVSASIEQSVTDSVASDRGL